MAKYFLFLLVPLGIFLAAFLHQATFPNTPSTPNVANTTAPLTRTETTSPIAAPAPAPFLLQAKQLVAAYPNHIQLDPKNGNAIIWKADGSRMSFDDGVREKDFEHMLREPDLQDQLAMSYPAGAAFTIENDLDPGRVRYIPFFKKMYGTTKSEVQANLETIYWLPSTSNQPLYVTRINGVNEKLQAVSDELDRLTQQPENRHLLAYLQNPAGTFKWRYIAGTDRLSPHSFGIAIDINSTHADYWRWSADGAARYQNSIPMEIVRVFEKHGFIWGGKWYHFDTMHFEYRPELLPDYRPGKR